MDTIIGEFLSWSVDAGFVVAFPLHHGDLELDSVGVSTKDHVAILVTWPWLGGLNLTTNVKTTVCPTRYIHCRGVPSVVCGNSGAYLRVKYTCARTLTENVGGRHWRSSQMVGTMPETRYLHQIIMWERCTKQLPCPLLLLHVSSKRNTGHEYMYIPIPHLPSLVLPQRSSHCHLQTHTPQCRSRKQLCPLCVQNWTLCATCLQKVYVYTTAVNFN